MMISLRKTLLSKPIFQFYKVLSAGQTKQCHWFPDYKPGPYPKTPEEHAAAAKKYNLLPEEYEPYPDDGNGSGDYPNLPFESVDSKDPYYNYDYAPINRDFMEPIHRDFKILFPEALSTGPARFTHFYGLKMFLMFCAANILFFYALYDYNIEMPVCEKQYPKPNVKHYSFELDYEKQTKGKKKPPCVCPEEEMST